jgi:hypothetical protein
MNAYNPLTGEGYTLEAARAAWAESTRPRHYEDEHAWQVRGEPGARFWEYWNFRDWVGRVTLEADGFHWQTVTYSGGAVIHEGVTTSVYEVAQSVRQNEPVRRKLV